MRGSRKFCQRGSKFNNVPLFSPFFSWWGDRGSKYHYKSAIIDTPAKRHLGFHWLANDGPTLNADFVALWFFRVSRPVLQRNPIFLWFFRRGGVWTPCPPPPLDPPMECQWLEVESPLKYEFCPMNAHQNSHQIWKWLCASNCRWRFKGQGYVCFKNVSFTVLPAKSDSDFMFCLQSYQGLIIDISHVYYSYPQEW